MEVKFYRSVHLIKSKYIFISVHNLYISKHGVTMSYCTVFTARKYGYNSICGKIDKVAYLLASEIWAFVARKC